MSKKIQAIRGVNDILPEQMPYWQHLEACLYQVVTNYGYSEIRFPVLEQTALFERTVGKATDIVEKEMYTFADRNQDSLTLRPEGTAGCTRACIQHGLTYNQTQRLWYKGAMFRHERPQKGRYRQFYQFGVEAYGIATPDIDVEHILMLVRIWRFLGLLDKLELQVNSLGSSDARAAYQQKLVEYFTEHHDHLDDDSKCRLSTNPLRILDSKNPAMQALIENAPNLMDHLDQDSNEHFNRFCQLLEHLDVQYVVNPRLVRGLDYYGRTVYEWIDKMHEGAQSAVCAGGRYDGLVEQLGGQSTPAVGFAMGLERVVDLLQTVYEPTHQPDFYVVLLGGAAQDIGMNLAEEIRSNLPDVCVITHCGGGSMKNQLKRADKTGARFALILGDEELEKEQVQLKDLRQRNPAQWVDIDRLVETIKKVL